MKRSAIFLSQPLLLLGVSAVLAGAASEEPLTLQNGPMQQATKQNEILHDIHGPLPMAGYPPYLMEAAIALLILLLLGLFFFILKRRKKPQPLPVSPWDAALLELDAARQLMHGGQSLLYMDQAGQILRRYIEGRFAIGSTRQTTREFFTGLEKTGNARLLEYRTELRACLEQADMAKFAHLAADLTIMEQMEAAVRTFIANTRPEVQTGGGKA